MIFVDPKEERKGADLETVGGGNKSELQLIKLVWDITIVNVCQFFYVHIPELMLALAFQCLCGIFLNPF